MRVQVSNKKKSNNNALEWFNAFTVIKRLKARHTHKLI